MKTMRKILNTAFTVEHSFRYVFEKYALKHFLDLTTDFENFAGSHKILNWEISSKSSRWGGRWSITDRYSAVEIKKIVNKEMSSLGN